MLQPPKPKELSQMIPITVQVTPTNFWALQLMVNVGQGTLTLWLFDRLLQPLLYLRLLLKQPLTTSLVHHPLEFLSDLKRGQIITGATYLLAPTVIINHSFAPL